MLFNTEDIWNKRTLKRHRQFVKDAMMQRLPTKPTRLIKYLISTYGEDIATAHASVLLQIINDIEERRSKLSAATDRRFRRECERLFNYKSFSRKGKKGWGAYALCLTSKYAYCPYCHENAIYTIFTDPKSGSIRPPLDHFYAQVHFPYLALSIYNLVPSCNTCNSTLKKEENFFLSPHLNPYMDEESIYFSLDVNRYLNLVSYPGREYSAGIVANPSAPTHPHHEKSTNSINTFLIQKRLDEQHNSIKINRFVKRLRSHNRNRQGEVSMLLGLLFDGMTEAEAIDFCRGNYKNEEFGTVKRDLYDLFWR
ncbi:hypothetical protein [Pseudomonas oryzihabitans]|uniref:hypothetical protein n=1 Tax=Pseudomonas oryzihabitans TaxID=47885 RepID=UPI00214EB496|nr:hypothetical protein [Pseudomonas psychrotolerans]UUW74336.1 hypothetical protein NRG74_23595 [Pseudomonas psychrotolerans]